MAATTAAATAGGGSSDHIFQNCTVVSSSSLVKLLLLSQHFVLTLLPWNSVQHSATLRITLVNFAMNWAQSNMVCSITVWDKTWSSCETTKHTADRHKFTYLKESFQDKDNISWFFLPLNTVYMRKYCNGVKYYLQIFNRFICFERSLTQENGFWYAICL
jgi:hypothetical protein